MRRNTFPACEATQQEAELLFCSTPYAWTAVPSTQIQAEYSPIWIVVILGTQERWWWSEAKEVRLTPRSPKSQIEDRS